MDCFQGLARRASQRPWQRACALRAGNVETGGRSRGVVVRATTLSRSRRRIGGGVPGVSLVADSSLNPRLLAISPLG